MLPPSETSLCNTKWFLPPKWTGCPCAMSLAVANWARVHPCLSHFSTSCHFRTSGFCLPFCGSALGISRPVTVPRAAAVFVIVLLFLQWRVDFALGLAFRPGHQCLGLSGGGSLSLASGFDASGTPGQAWRNTALRSCASTPEFDFTRVRNHDCECKPKDVRVSGVAIQDMSVVRCWHSNLSSPGLLRSSQAASGVQSGGL